MPTPFEFMRQYRDLRVTTAVDDPQAQVCREVTYTVQLTKYFMMNWTPGSNQMRDYTLVTRGSRSDPWFDQNRERIRNAGMGKGSPLGYTLALEWAVRSAKIPTVNQRTLQQYCDDHLGIDCSGFVTNYLIAVGKKAYSATTVRNTGAASYFNATKAINDPTAVRQGDILVWMRGNAVMSGPGHVAVVESYRAECCWREYARGRSDGQRSRKPQAPGLVLHGRADH